MKLLRIRLRDFRGVHDRELTLAEHGVTVVQGDNEVGKTSTVAALDLLLDVPDSSKRAEVKAAAPAGRDAGPQVEAELVTGDYHLVYRKRWLRRPLTELDVRAPRREQLTGAEAHARVGAILDETLDRDLWRALRVEQHTPAGQAPLGGHGALTRALDRAAGGELEAGAEADAGLVERAEAELRRYRTPTGRPARELAAAEDRLADARAEHERCAAAVAAVEADVAERDRLDRELVDLAARREEHRARVAELEDRWTALQSRLSEVAGAAERAALARERADTARTRTAARTALVAEIAGAQEAATRAADRVADHDHAHTAARAERDGRRDAHERARAGAGAARAAAAAARAALDTARDREELARLDAATARVAEAERGLADTERTLAATAVDDDDLARLDELELAGVRARAARDAEAVAVELEVPTGAGALAVGLDGEPETLAPGATRRVAVHDAATVTLPGVLEVRVRSGREGRGLADAADTADDALAAACAELGVAGAAQARAVHRHRTAARREHDEHRAALDRELAGRDPAEVRAQRDRLRARLGWDVGGDGEAPDPGSAALRDDADRTRAAAEAADDAVDAADRRRREADDDARDAETRAALLAERAAEAAHTLDRRRADLDATRAQAGDDDLAAEEATLRARARDAENTHQALAAALAAEDPDSVEALVTSARGVDARYDADLADRTRARAEATGRLQSAGLAGWHDQLVEAADERDAAERDHAAVARRARAAARLHETLARHRDAVRRAYVAPFRAQVERLARIVFGPDVALEVDPALRITHRTLGGVTVAFDDLSRGAQEQLGLCARLACAALVDPAEGVPVIIDDALGHSDPARLARLGAVFTAATAGGAGQVVVLTCTPERYRAIGAATVVTLSPSRPDPAPHTDPIPLPEPAPHTDSARPTDPARLPETG